MVQIDRQTLISKGYPRRIGWQSDGVQKKEEVGGGKCLDLPKEDRERPPQSLQASRSASRDEEGRMQETNQEAEIQSGSNWSSITY